MADDDTRELQEGEIEVLKCRLFSLLRRLLQAVERCYRQRGAASTDLRLSCA